MSNPIPKSKLDEVADTIYRDPDELHLSEFQAARLLRMVKEAEHIDYLRASTHRMMIYYQSNKYREAKEEIRNLIPFLSGNASLYRKLIGMSLRIAAFDELVSIINSLDIDMLKQMDEVGRKGVLIGLSLPTLVSGGTKDNLAQLELFKEHFTGIVEQRANREATARIRDLQAILKRQNFCTEKIKELFKILSKLVSDRGVRILTIAVSVPDDEILIELFVLNSIDEVLALDDALFQLAYDKKLINELTALSVSFHPTSMETLANDA